MLPDIETISDDFAVMDDWEDRYRYLIDLGRDLAPYPDELRDAEHKVSGCASQVWLDASASAEADPVITFRGDSDAHIVRGLVAVMIALLSGRKASDIVSIDVEAVFRKLGLDSHLSQQRANGLRAMVRRMKQEASAAGSANWS
jgi:cysteine desulfuration protein SufE